MVCFKEKFSFLLLLLCKKSLLSFSSRGLKKKKLFPKIQRASPDVRVYVYMYTYTCATGAFHAQRSSSIQLPRAGALHSRFRPSKPPTPTTTSDNIHGLPSRTSYYTQVSTIHAEITFPPGALTRVPMKNGYKSVLSIDDTVLILFVDGRF